MAAAREALVPVVEAPGRENIACRFVLEGEGDRFVSGVEGVWIIGMGDADADAEFGFRFRVEFGCNKFGFKFGFGVLLMAFAFEVEVPAAAAAAPDDDDDDCCSFWDTCERFEVGFRCVTKRWTI
jgi:hypothetical protein